MPLYGGGIGDEQFGSQVLGGAELEGASGVLGGAELEPPLTGTGLSAILVATIRAEFLDDMGDLIEATEHEGTQNDAFTELILPGLIRPEGAATLRLRLFKRGALTGRAEGQRLGLWRGPIGAAYTRSPLVPDRDGFLAPIRTIATSDDIVRGDYTLLGDASGGEITLTLPAAASVPGWVFVIKRLNGGGNNVIVAAAGGDAVDGGSDVTLNTQWSAVRVQSDGNDWFTI